MKLLVNLDMLIIQNSQNNNLIMKITKLTSVEFQNLSYNSKIFADCTIKKLNNINNYSDLIVFPETHDDIPQKTVFHFNK